ncbi:ER membrane protein DP1/Yop1 [Geranomyces michiganensis]|nr:ER membrane protein DP1/Yop1 [Geranomyces michiganensis]
MSALAYQQQFDNYLGKFRTLRRIEKATGVPKVYFTLAIYTLVSISVFFQIKAGFTTSLLALIYPSYRMFESSYKDDTDGLKVWATYFWFSSLVSFAELARPEQYVPFFYVAKLVILFGMFLPGYLGAKHLHDAVAPLFVPFFKAAEDAAKSN